MKSEFYSIDNSNLATKETVCDCGCVRTYPAEAIKRYEDSRRDFLRKALMTGTAAALLPFIAEAEAEADLFKPSVADQKKLGLQASAEILKKYPEVKDSRATSFRRVGERLVEAMGDKRGPWDYSFRVLKSDEVNAFALPGGPMFINTGLIDRIKSADELAGVTAHETQHVRLEHWAKQQASQQERGLGLGLLLGLFKAGGTAQAVVGSLNSIWTLKFSRGDEDAADSNGLNVMYGAGYDPEGLIDLFNTLKAASGGKGGGAPEFFSTHPLTDNRIKKAKERIAKLKAQKPQPQRTQSRNRAGDTSPR